MIKIYLFRSSYQWAARKRILVYVFEAKKSCFCLLVVELLPTFALMVRRDSWILNLCGFVFFSAEFHSRSWIMNFSAIFFSFSCWFFPNKTCDFHLLVELVGYVFGRASAAEFAENLWNAKKFKSKNTQSSSKFQLHREKRGRKGCSILAKNIFWLS